MVSGLQAGVGSPWKGSSSSGSGVWELALARVRGNLQSVRVSGNNDPDEFPEWISRLSHYSECLS